MTPGSRRLLLLHAVTATSTTVPVPLVAATVYGSTHSAVALAAAGAARMIPTIVLGGVAGRLVDRLGPHRLLRASAALRAALTALLATALLLHAPAVVLLAVVLATGVAATPAYTGAAALAYSTWHGPEQQAATAGLTAVETAAWVAGPALGGLLLAAGVGWAAPLAAAAALAWVAGRRPPGRALASPPAVHRTSPAHPSMRRILAPVAVVVTAVVTANLAIDGAAAVLVQLARSDFGLLTAALGGGAAAALLAAGRTRPRHLPLYLTATALCLAAASLTTWTPLRAALLLAAGACAVAVEAAATLTVQLRVPPGRQGEALGVLDQAIIAGAMAGAVLAPVCAAAVGAQSAILTAAVLLLPAAAGAALHRGTGAAEAAAPVGGAPPHARESVLAGSRS